MKIKYKLEKLLERFYAESEISAIEMLSITTEVSDAVASLNSSQFFIPIMPADIHNIANEYLTEKNKELFIINIYNDLFNQFNEYANLSYSENAHSINKDINTLIRCDSTRGIYVQKQSEAKIKENLYRQTQESSEKKDNYNYIFEYMTNINNFFGGKIVINCYYTALFLNEQRNNKVSQLLGLFEVITTIEHECVHLNQDIKHGGFVSIEKDANPTAYLTDRYEQEAILKSLLTAYAYVTQKHLSS